MWFLPLLLGCRAPCGELCERDADCIATDLEAAGSDWPSFTGFADREAWSAACEAAFDEAAAEGGDRDRQDDLCASELEKTCP